MSDRLRPDEGYPDRRNSADNVPVPIADPGSAEIRNWPLDKQVQDIRDRLKLGNERHDWFRDQITLLWNTIAPRVRPYHLWKAVVICGAIISAAVSAYVLFAKATEVSALEQRVREVERAYDRLAPLVKGATP